MEVYRQKLLATLNTEEGRDQNQQSYIQVKSGEFEDLARYMMFVSPEDASSVEAFLLTYRGFGYTPENMFDVIAAQYRQLHRVDKLQMIAEQIPVFFQLWIRLNYFSDFVKEGGLLDKTLDFFATIAQEAEESRQETEDVETSLELIISNKIKLAFLRTQRLYGKRNRKKKQSKRPPMDIALEELPASVIADQLTLIEWDLFTSIEVPELLNMSWKAKNRLEIAANVVAMVERTNLVSYWLSTEICTYYNLKKRIKLVEKIINVAWKCSQAHNFATTMEIMGGLNNVAITRLKKTWKGISERCKERWDKLTQLMDTAGNYAVYRASLLNARTQKIPAIPFLGVFLRDLTFIEDGNENLINGEQINFEKNKLLGTLIKDFTDMQRTPYTIRKVAAIYQPLVDISIPDGADEAVYQLSLLVEPKAAP